MLEETVTDANTGTEIKKIVYTIGHDQIAQTTFTPGGASEGDTLVFHYDGHGSTRVLTDLAAALVQMFTYDAYGQLLAIHNATGQFVSANASAAATQYLHSGEQFDTRINQQYLRARYYDSVTARFNRSDPYAGNSQDPQSLHKYLYTHADPVNGIDPTGRFSLSVSIASIGIAGIFGSIAGAAVGAILCGFECAVTGAASGALFSMAITAIVLSGGAGIHALIPAVSEIAAAFWIGTAINGFFIGHTIYYISAAETPRERAAGIVALLFMLAGQGLSTASYLKLMALQAAVVPKTTSGNRPPTPINKNTGKPMTLGEFNEVIMKWGGGKERAIARAKEITKADLAETSEHTGVTPKIARMWRDFYIRAELEGLGGRSAEGRIVLMQRSLELVTPYPLSIASPPPDVIPE